MTDQKKLWLGWALLALITVVIYSPALSGTFLWDDIQHIRSDPRTWQHIWNPGYTSQYYPLTYSSFYIERNYLWGNHPEGYHLVNLLLQILNAALLWQLLKDLKINGAWLAAGLFAIHPINVESVAWLSERKNLLAGIFYLSAFIFYLRFALPEVKKNIRWWWISFSLYCCALLSKTATCVFPIVVMALLFWKKKKLARQDFYPLIPFLIAGLGLGLLTVYLEHTRAGARGALWALSFPQRFIIAGKTACFYLQKLVWPYPLIPTYPRWTINAQNWLLYLYPASMAGLAAALLLLCKKIGKAPAAAFLIYLIHLFPVMGFFNISFMRYSFVADHFAYYASIAPLAGFAALIQRISAHAIRRILAGLILLIFAFLAWKQSHIYQNPKTFWGHTLRHNPNSYAAQNNYGYELSKEGRMAEAKEHYLKAIKIYPGFDAGYLNLGYIAATERDFETAGELFKQALALSPNFAAAHINYANILALQHKNEEAIAHHREALAIDPYVLDAHLNLGSLLLEQGDISAAFEHFQKALRSGPDIAGVHFTVGKAYLSTGNTDQAIHHLRQALALEPSLTEAGNHLDLALKIKQQKTETD